MKKVEPNRYPNSATLFKFCKEALEIRYDGNVKVIDQDVGAILGYDPADCSHWKKGKKNIRALATLRSIADHLSIDERILIDIASGRMQLDEALFEYRGYGDFSLDGRILEALKKEFFRNPSKWQGDGDVKPFEELFDVNRPGVIRAAQNVIDAGSFKEAPIYIPEVYQLYSGIRLIADESVSGNVEVAHEGEGANLHTTVKIASDEMKPYVRFLTAKELFKFLVRSGSPVTSHLAEGPEEVLDIQGNIFAAALLVPGQLLKKEVELVDSSKDLVMQLAETFWISKALMNQRLRDYLENFS